jgi:hypothetical protein
MTETDSQATAPHRPPVRQATTVRSGIDHTFDVFVRTIGQWWPAQPLSMGKDRLRDITFERRVGGQVYETWDDGSTAKWGEVLAWDPPSGFTMSWECTPGRTEVEMSFAALGPALTRVAVEHRGWESLSETQTQQDCALPGGGYAGGSYNRGWAMILDRFAVSLGGAAVES